MRYIGILFILISSLGCTNSNPSNIKLNNALLDTTILIRGTIIEIAKNDYRFDYFDVVEADSQTDFLQERGFQGGGYSWEGILYGAIKLSEPKILSKIRFDSEAEGLVIWSSDKASLEKIGRLIAVVKSDDLILNECISVAKKRLKME